MKKISNLSSLIIVCLFVLFISMTYSACQYDSPESIKEESIIGDYIVRVYKDSDSGYDVLKILKDNKTIYEKEGFRFRTGLMYEVMPANEFVKPGMDITGDGIANVVISHWSGGAHCCFDFYVFSLGDEFSLIKLLKAGNCDLAVFEDLNDDGVLEFIYYEYVFDYWNASFFESPHPQTILTYKDGKYVLALELMQKPLPSKEEELKIIKQVEEDRKDIIKRDLYSGWRKGDALIPPIVWAYMNDLIYTGHKEEAFQFLDKIWQGDKSLKKEFIKEFLEVLQETDYYNDLMGINPRRENK